MRDVFITQLLEEVEAARKKIEALEKEQQRSTWTPRPGSLFSGLAKKTTPPDCAEDEN